MEPDKKHILGGLLVMFEGIDGVGKTTQLELVEKTLTDLRWDVVTSRSPGGTPIGEALRSVMLDTMARPPKTDLYISVAIQEALIEALSEKRAKNSVILLDRGPLSLAPYQIYGSGIEEALGWHYVDDGMNRLRPDLTIIYECDPKIAIERARQHSQKADYFESKPISYFERVADGYREAAKRYDAVTIDASQAIEAIHDETMHHITELLEQKSIPVS